MRRRRSTIALTLGLFGLAVVGVAVLVGESSDEDPQRRWEEPAKLRPVGKGPPAPHPQPAAEDAPSGVDSEPAAPSIDVVVKSERLTPAVGARIRVARADENRVGGVIVDSQEATSDGAGMARIVLPRDWARSSVFVAAYSADGELASSSVRCEIGTKCIVILGAAHTIHGRVIGLRDGEWRTAYVLAYSPHWPESPGRSQLRLTADGTFVVRGATQFVGLVAFSEGRAPSRYWSSDLPRATSEVVELELGPASVPAQVRVVDETGARIPNGARALVSSGGRAWLGGSVNPDGVLTLPGVSPGDGASVVLWPFRVAEDQGWYTATSEGKFSADELHGGGELRVARAARAKFRILDYRGEPVSGALLYLGRATPEGGDWSAHESRDDGILAPFERVARPSGEYRLKSQAGAEIWSGRITHDDEYVEVPTSLEAVEVLLQTSDGRAVKIADVAAGIVRRGEPSDKATAIVAREPFVTFKDSGARVLLMERGQAPECVVRSLFRWSGHMDVELVAGPRAVIAIPAELGEVRVALRMALDGAVFRMSRSDRAHVRYELSDWHERVGTIHAIVPGRYRWEVTVGVARVRVGEFDVVGGTITEVGIE